MTEPTTAAGRKMLYDMGLDDPIVGKHRRDTAIRRIRAIEKEAASLVPTPPDALDDADDWNVDMDDYMAGYRQAQADAQPDPPLDVDRLREAVDAALFDAEIGDSHPGCRVKWRRIAMDAFDAYAKEATHG